MTSLYLERVAKQDSNWIVNPRYVEKGVDVARPYRTEICASTICILSKEDIAGYYHCYIQHQQKMFDHCSEIKIQRPSHPTSLGRTLPSRSDCATMSKSIRAASLSGICKAAMYSNNKLGNSCSISSAMPAVRRRSRRRRMIRCAGVCVGVRVKHIRRLTQPLALIWKGDAAIHS